MEPTQDPFEGDKTFAELVFAALDHATFSLEGPTLAPLIPFAMTRAGEQRRLNRFLGADYQADVDHALTFARQGDFDCWAVAWDGYITLEGERSDAVFVRAARRHANQAVLFAWRYERPAPTAALRKLGNPVFLGHEPP